MQEIEVLELSYRKPVKYVKCPLCKCGRIHIGWKPQHNTIVNSCMGCGAVWYTNQKLSWLHDIR